MELNIFPSSQSFSVTLNSCGKDSEAFGNFVFGPLITRSTLIQYCHCGKGQFEINGNIFDVSAGDCIVSFDGELRKEIGSSDPWSFSWLYLSGESVSDFLSRLNITPENPVIPNCKESRIPELFDEIIKTADAHNDLRDIILASKVFEFFAALAHMRSDHHATDASPLQDEYVSQAIYYMNMHYMERDLRVDTLAKNIGLNRSYLYVLFKNKTGMSPQEYLAHLRVKSACELLKLPRATVSSVANSVGYEPLVFTRTFKKIVGITPNEYIKKALQSVAI